MASNSFWLQLQTTIAAVGGLSTVSYAVSERQTLTINGLTWVATSAWGFYSIRNSNGLIFTNASQANPLPGTAFQNNASPNISPLMFPYPMVIVGSDIIYFDIINGAGAANTIQLTLHGSLDRG